MIGEKGIFREVYRQESIMLDVCECIKPDSYVSSNIDDVMNFVNDRREPMVITQDGKSRAVLVDVETYQDMKRAFGLLKIIQLSEKDVQAGRTEPATMVFQDLRRKYNVGK